MLIHKYTFTLLLLIVDQKQVLCHFVWKKVKKNLANFSYMNYKITDPIFSVFFRYVDDEMFRVIHIWTI